MHPYQDQVNQMWGIIKKRIKAKNNGFWMEAIDLTYILLEIELRLLLTSKAGDEIIPPHKIDDQKYLMNLANLSKDSGFIDQTIWMQIQKFNNCRKQAIHGLAQGDIKYEDLEDCLKDTTELVGNIQNQWLPIKFGKVEKRPSV